ncbi:hypothetical protein DXJ84_24655 [Vibrio parahaemolyticus]|uniref:AAA family ATPase n=1 Tax=Vibrio parahaemolyticus TaxID=670 RepID=UPI00111D5303|nr:AAA family ATPase [Vibrio parahaemolyticus]TPA20962.1 hypothetical protein DXJ84_24655 [Vibrio parahaemolyticus]
MGRWRIHRLKINGFKVFSEFEESYSSDLIVYDGPNGFGKTSLFDAKQLLFCNNLPRVSARHSALKIGNKTFTKNLYQNHDSQQDVSIVAELKNDSESIYIMRLAKKTDLDTSKNKPNNFEDFKLYELTDFDIDADPKLIVDERKFWDKKLGDKFLSNFSVLNYLQQDSKAIVIPDACDNRKRTDKISHLLNLDNLERRIDNIVNLKNESKEQLKIATDNHMVKKSLLEDLQKTLTVSDSEKITYTKLTNSKVTPQWDLEFPFFIDNLNILEQMLDQVNVLKQVYLGRNEISKRIRNKQKIEFTKRDEFSLAIRLHHHFNKLPSLNSSKFELDKLEKLCNVLNNEVSKLSSTHIKTLSFYLEASVTKDLSKLIEEKSTLFNEHSGFNKQQTEMIQLRKELFKVCDTDEHDCPLCGFNYKTNALLTSAIDEKTGRLKDKLDKVGLKITQCYKEIEEIINPLKLKYIPLLEKLRRDYEGKLHSELSAHEHQANRLTSIGLKLISQGIKLPEHYSIDENEQIKQVENVKSAIFKSLEPEGDNISEKEFTFFSNQFSKVSDLDNLSEELIDLKYSYIQQQHKLTINSSILKREKEVNKCAEKVSHLQKLNTNLGKIETQLKHAQTDYMNQTIGQMESLFHIYSGRLLQNYQSGLGVFIDTPDSKRKTSAMNFTTARDSQHDAILSMSSGQISALSLSLFLALNKKYAKTAFVFIDDPTQCMDEINIASLSDLLRVELRDRQVIISTHEQDISDYLCYRYGKAGLSRKQINLLEKNKRNV